MYNRNSKLHAVIVCGLFAAITAILAQVEIPLPIVPISGQTLAVGLTATIIGSRYGAIAMVCYALLGAVGLPVFAGFKGGAQILIGPTGGYIFGFILTAYVTGLILEKTKFTITMAMIANTIGMIITLIFGTVQLKLVLDMTWGQALGAGVYPFIAVGLIKAFLASWLGIIVRRRLIQAKLINQVDKRAA
ncbi:biotin transporter BioY [Radiobacillus kanasensis]|uniref:biotin transporter BioY n=1 Tax=Radiobacillus kanasensis TaxID=2844358 RepID=UPI001E4CCDDC|nr:biotin transporter BioY [Radiobacillus kanasensis]UFU00299.1 biotin transporter BioY [Radiobacillus kanasensis]